ncbi:MAG: type II toxin-antitoxin system RatA family toxin [Betaproteobacteria bacterium]|nr:type II toxin-antitoxin system RatA family toxin [Betaproteobacteria bacterium]
MKTVERSVLIGHSAQRMFDLVDRVEEYPQFLPWCARTELIARDEKRTSATLYINYHGVKAHFSTENEKEIPSLMLIRLLDGPFRRLEGQWRFRALAEDACKIEFSLSYEFSSRLLEKVIGPVFGKIAGSFVDAFIKRAQECYGG